MKDKIKSILYFFILVQLLMAVPTFIDWKEIIPFQYNINWFMKFLSKDARIVVMSFSYLWIAFVYLEEKFVFILFLFYNIFQVWVLCSDYKVVNSLDSFNDSATIILGVLTLLFLYKK